MKFLYVFLFEFPYGYIAEIDLATITDRMAVKKAVQDGHVVDAIEKVNDLNPEVCFFCYFATVSLLLLLPLFI